MEPYRARPTILFPPRASDEAAHGVWSNHLPVALRCVDDPYRQRCVRSHPSTRVPMMALLARPDDFDKPEESARLWPDATFRQALAISYAIATYFPFGLERAHEKSALGCESEIEQ
jgi:hypothetical protein